MMLSPTKDEAVRLAKEGRYGCIPVSCELYADTLTPIAAVRVLKKVSRHCFLLESAEASKKWGRYTFLGFAPRLELTCQDGELTLTNGGTQVRRTAHPGESIRQILRENRAPKLSGLPPFAGGLVGYFSYDYIHYAEPTLDFSKLKNDDFCDVDLMLFDRVIVFDHYRQKLILIAGVRTDSLEKSYRHSQQ